MAAETPTVSEPQTPPEKTMSTRRNEKIGRLLVMIATVVFAIFLVYLLLIVVFPSMNIGMSP